MLQKLEKLVFYVFVFSIPFQTRVILRSWGIGFNEWNSAFLYWTDLLILALLGLWGLRFFIGKAQLNFSNYDWFLIGLLAVSAISIKNALNPALGWYQFLKLTEFSLLYFYLKSGGFGFSDLKVSFGILFASGFFQAILAILQYIRQADLGLRFLGETVLRPELFNIAVFAINGLPAQTGEKILRPYGTFPHPNVLALFLFMSVFIYYFFYIVKNRFLHSWIGLVFYAVLLSAFFLTFSRVIILVWAVGAGLKWLIFNKKFSQIAEGLNLRKLIATTFTVIALFSVFLLPQVLGRFDISFQDQAVALRGFYSRVALFEKPFFGVGIGNFVNWFREINPGLPQNLYQPVHNIYLLIFSETGVLGLAAFLFFLIFLSRNYLKIKFSRPLHYSFFIIFLSLLVFGFFDHFLWTLQQGRIMFWLAAGLIAATFTKTRNVPVV